MPCVTREKYGYCYHHQCPYNEYTPHGYVCVDLTTIGNITVCEVGKDCYPECPYSLNGISLKEAVLYILQSWDGWWYTYDMLLDQLYDFFGIETNRKEVKEAIKELEKEGLVEFGETFSEQTGLINGSGWFVTHEGRRIGETQCL